MMPPFEPMTTEAPPEMEGFSFTQLSGMDAIGAAPPPPTADDLHKELSSLQTTFSLRDDVIRQWKRIARVSRLYSTATRTERKILSADQIDASLAMSLPATLVEEVVRRCASRRYQVRVALRGLGPEARQAAELQENVITAAFRELNRHHRMMGGSASLDAEMYRWLAETGHCYELVRPQPLNRDLPWRTELLDPETVYPALGRDGLERVYICRNMTVRQIRADLGDDLMPDETDPDAEHTVVIVYDRFYVALMLDTGQFIREPMLHDYGCVPIIWTFVNGLPGVATDNGLTLDEVEAYRGRSMLATLISELEHVERVMETILYVTYRGANPPLQIEGAEGVAGPRHEVDLSPGVVNPVAGRIGPIELDSDSLRELQTTLAVLLGNIRAATIALQDDRQFTSGFDRTAASRASQTFLDPFLQAAEWHIQRRGELVAKFLNRFGDTFSVRMPAGAGRSFVLEVFAEDVPEDLDIEILTLPMNELDQLQALSVGTQANAAGLMSKFDLFDKILMFQDASEMVERANQDQLLRNPAVAEAQAPMAAAMYYRDLSRTLRNQGDDEMAMVAEAMAAKYMRDIIQGLQQAQQPPPSPQQQLMAALQQGGPPIPPQQMNTQGPVPMAGPASSFDPGMAMANDPMAGMPGVPPQYMPPEMQSGGMPSDAAFFGQGG